MNRKTLSLLILLFIILLNWNMNAQEYLFLESILEYMEDENEENLEWLDYLWSLIENPLNLNRVSYRELCRIPFITPVLAKKIIEYRTKRNGIKHLEELIQISDLSEELYEALLPFVTLKEKSLQKNFTNRLRFRYETPPRRGFLENIYHSRIFFQNRFLFQVNRNLSGGFFLEKDSGEKDITDYNSYHIYYHNSRRGFAVLTGDFYMKIGMGLLLWPAYGVPLSPYFRPYSNTSDQLISENKSSNEFQFLRGISLSKILSHNHSLYIYYSKKPLDAGISSDHTHIQTISTTGLHRTENEIKKSGCWDTELFGFTWYNFSPNISTQLSLVQTNYSLPFQTLDRNQRHISLFLNGGWGNLRSAGEICIFQNKYPAVQQYFHFDFKKGNYDVVTYYYHPRYFALFGRSFASLSSIPENKFGTAFILRYTFITKAVIGAYAHFYKDNLNGLELPFLNRDFLVEITQKSGKQQIKFQYKQQYRKNSREVVNDEKIRRSLRLSYDLNMSKKFHIQNRLELRWATPLDPVRHPYGISFYQQIKWNFFNQWWLLTRWTTFDVPDYDLSIYEYEPDLPGTFKTTLLNDRGYKIIFLLRMFPVKSIQLDFKYFQRFYPDLKTVGSGLDKFNTNRIHEFKLSLIWKYH